MKFNLPWRIIYKLIPWPIIQLACKNDYLIFLRSYENWMLNKNSILAFDFQFSPVILETNLTVKDWPAAA